MTSSSFFSLSKVAALIIEWLNFDEINSKMYTYNLYNL